MNKTIRLHTKLDAPRYWVGVLVLLLCVLPLRTGASKSDEYKWPIVSRGDLDTNNVDVTIIQYLLRARGFSINVDGSFGARMQWQVRRFQQSRKLKATGVVDGANSSSFYEKGLMETQ